MESSSSAFQLAYHGVHLEVVDVVHHELNNVEIAILGLLADELPDDQVNGTGLLIEGALLFSCSLQLII